MEGSLYLSAHSGVALVAIAAVVDVAAVAVAAVAGVVAVAYAANVAVAVDVAVDLKCTPDNIDQYLICSFFHFCVGASGMNWHPRRTCC